MIFLASYDSLEAIVAKGKGGRERIIPPSKRETTSGSSALRKGSSSGARVMADASVAKKQGVKRPPGR
jgi:hypothetical protein